MQKDFSCMRIHSLISGPLQDVNGTLLSSITVLDNHSYFLTKKHKIIKHCLAHFIKKKFKNPEHEKNQHPKTIKLQTSMAARFIS